MEVAAFFIRRQPQMPRRRKSSHSTRNRNGSRSPKTRRKSRVSSTRRAARTRSLKRRSPTKRPTRRRLPVRRYRSSPNEQTFLVLNNCIRVTLTNWPEATIDEPVYPFDITFQFNDPDRNLALRDAGKYTLTALLYLQTNSTRLTIGHDGQVSLPENPIGPTIELTFTIHDNNVTHGNPDEKRSFTVTSVDVFRQLSNVIITFTKPDGKGTQTICKTLKSVLPPAMQGIEIG